jgi:hypothetical protein
MSKEDSTKLTLSTVLPFSHFTSNTLEQNLPVLESILLQQLKNPWALSFLEHMLNPFPILQTIHPLHLTSFYMSLNYQNDGLLSF